MGFFDRLKSGLKKTKDGFVRGLDEVFNGSLELDDDFYEELEDALIMGDVGARTTEEILDKLQAAVKEGRIRDTKESRAILQQIIADMLVGAPNGSEAETAETVSVGPEVILIVGVNGVGKTTTVGKLAAKFKDEGKSVVIAAADTFRAAAADQLKMWADRAGCTMIGGQEGNDPASVVFDAVSAAKARKADVLLVDTAGRLHNKKNLMNELAKINRILDRELEGCKKQTLCVLDATTGQNALMQAREFNEASDLTGLVLTKMDGTAKGGIAIAICTELDIPVRYIGVGEQKEDLEEFNPQEFVAALFGE